MPDPIYLDHAATTPVRAEVVEAMAPFYGARFGNPSSTHRWGREARTALDEARERVAACLGAASDEVCFTSGGTEADNLAILGGWRVRKDSGRVAVITTPVEHKAVLASVHKAAAEGAQERMLQVDADGLVSLENAREIFEDDVAIVSVMWVNNEIGTIQPIPELAELAKSRGVIFHTDAVQAFGKVEVNARKVPFDFAAISGHKIGAPKGIGAMYLRRGTALEPLFFGGTQDRGRRPGTENVAYAVGLATACELAIRDREASCAKYKALRDRLEAACAQCGAEVMGAGAPRLPNTSCLTMPGISSETQIMALDLDGIAVSAGAACSSGKVKPSRVLTAMGLNDTAARSAIRASFGWKTVWQDFDALAEAWIKMAARARPQLVSVEAHV